MDKKVFVNTEKKVAVVVLYNREFNITARGKAVCCEQDTFNEELGIKLANTRAWRDYYVKLAKNADKEVTWYKEYIAKEQAWLEKSEQLKEIAEKKFTELDKEYQDMLASI